MHHPLIKFDEKHNGEVTEFVQQTILNIDPIFVQKWILDHPKIIQDNFHNGCEFDNLKNTHKYRFIQIRWFQ